MSALFGSTLNDTKTNIVPSKVGQSGFAYGYMPNTDVPVQPKCPPRGAAAASAGASPTASRRQGTITPDTPFLKDVIKNEKDSIETLLKIASKIGPLAQTVVQKEEAYDAAFETTDPSPIPGPSGTMQGFALLMFFASYLILAIVMTVYVFQSSESEYKAATTLIIFTVGGAIVLSVLGRIG
jgi:hypothetical protein